MVNIMLSLFTPSMAFQMSDDDIFAKYLREVSKPDTRTLTIQNIGEGCWEWMTNSEKLANSGRAPAMLELFTKQAEEEIDDIFVESLEDSDKALLLPQGDWPEIFDDYVEKVKTKMTKRYAHDSPEEEKARVVHLQIMRRLEWVTMRHPTRTISRYPLLTKSVLPKIADQLQQVQRSIAEVSIII